MSAWFVDFFLNLIDDNFSFFFIEFKVIALLKSILVHILICLVH